MTAGDKFKLGLTLAFAGHATFKTVRGIYVAYRNERRVSQLLHLLTVASNNPRCHARCEARVAELIHLLHLLSIVQMAELGKHGVKLYETTGETVLQFSANEEEMVRLAEALRGLAGFFHEIQPQFGLRGRKTAEDLLPRCGE